MNSYQYIKRKLGGGLCWFEGDSIDLGWLL